MSTAAALPSSVRHLVLTRLPDLSPAARDVIDAAVVGEGHVHHRLLQRACELAPAEFTEAIGPSIDAGILEVSPTVALRVPARPDAGGLDEAHAPEPSDALARGWARTLAEGAAPLSAHETAILIAQHWSAAGDDDEALRSALGGARAAAQLSAPKQEAELVATGLVPVAGERRRRARSHARRAGRSARALLFAAQAEELLPGAVRVRSHRG